MAVFLRESRSGCWLPSLILFNLAFGWLIIRPAGLWLLVEGLLLLIFILQLYFAYKSIVCRKEKDGQVIDVEAKVIDNKEKTLKNG